MKYKLFSKRVGHKYILFDDADLIKVFNYRWNIAIRGRIMYVFSSSVKSGMIKGFYMHHLILPKKAGYVVDHINRNGLDNRRKNLRYLKHGENLRYGAPHKDRKYKGVYYTKRNPPLRKPWAAKISRNRRPVHLGYFHTAEEASEVFNKVSSYLFKNKTWLNKSTNN